MIYHVTKSVVDTRSVAWLHWIPRAIWNDVIMPLSGNQTYRSPHVPMFLTSKIIIWMWKKVNKHLDETISTRSPNALPRHVSRPQCVKRVKICWTTLQSEYRMAGDWYSLVNINFAPIRPCKNNRRIPQYWVRIGGPRRQWRTEGWIVVSIKLVCSKHKTVRN